MTSRELSRFALSVCVAAAMLAGCGGSQPPIGAPGAMPQTSAIATHAERGKSWMLPEAKPQDLLYVSREFHPGEVSVYSYPKGKLMGNLTDIAGVIWVLLVTDAKGDVFAISTEKPKLIYEYAHDLPKRSQHLMMRATVQTGALLIPHRAISRLTGGGLSNANFAIYQNAQGTPTVYKEWQCGRGSRFARTTPNGNLFAGLAAC